jgi:predicted transcriptional regulator
MKVIDGRGKNKKELSKKNRASVKKWFLENPGSYILDCCKGTGLTYRTVRGHINALESGVK